MEPVDFSGPSALVCGAAGEETLRQAIDLIVRYARKTTPEGRVRWRSGDGFRYRTLGEPAGARPLAPGPADGALPIISRNAP